MWGIIYIYIYMEVVLHKQIKFGRYDFMIPSQSAVQISKVKIYRGVVEVCIDKNRNYALDDI